jgi:hypothetical protein
MFNIDHPTKGTNSWSSYQNSWVTFIQCCWLHVLTTNDGDSHNITTINEMTDSIVTSNIGFRKAWKVFRVKNVFP